MVDFDPNRKPSKRSSGRFGRRKSGGPRREFGRRESSGPRRDSGRFGRRDDRPRRDDRRNSESQERHKIICDTCGETCEVPFKPTKVSEKD